MPAFLWLHRLSAAAAIAVGVLFLSSGVFAQNPPLGEVARKEQERRKNAKPAGKVLTNKDLPKTSAPATSTSKTEPSSEAASSQAAESATSEKTEKTDKPAKAEPEKDEAWWKGRITKVREALARDEILLEALQSRVNALSTEFVNRDDPHQRARIGDDRQKALAEMQRLKADIDQQKKTIEDIEEEARRAGVPPGWLR